MRKCAKSGPSTTLMYTQRTIQNNLQCEMDFHEEANSQIKCKNKVSV